MNLPKLTEFLASQQLPAYRLRQIIKNYYSGRYQSFLQMTDLPDALRLSLDQNIPLYSVSPNREITGGHTHKAQLALADKSQIETVLMDYGQWQTACVSSQVGCPLACTFCATGQMGLKRNLSAEEIVDQVLFWNQKIYPQYVGRIVFMGMGEPFLNWDNLLEAIKILNSKSGINIGNRKISVSTAGIVPRIVDFANLHSQINLAVSLHSLRQEVRQTIMPIAKQYHLDQLLDSIQYYTHRTKRQLFLEYALMDGINDTNQDLDLLISLLKSNPLLFLNLIPLNFVSGGMKPATNSRLQHFTRQLSLHKLNYSVRQSLGQQIQSACGQLIANNKV